MRQVVHDGQGSFEIRFPYDARLVGLVKGLPRRRWVASGRFWAVPDGDVVAVVESLHPEGFSFCEVTRRMYRDGGGVLVLGAAFGSPPVRSGPSLFDEPAPERPAPAPADPGDWTVSRLNGEVKAALQRAFPASLWLTGEISGFGKSAHKRIVSFQIVEPDPEGRTPPATVGAVLFEDTRREIERRLEAAGNPFRLEDEIAVRVRVKVDLYVPWGSYRVVVEDLDLAYTLGEAARRREEIVRRLSAEGLLERNPSLPFPEVPLRVGLVTSLGSDAFGDVLRTLQESGFAFRVVAHGARVQGRSTEPSVLNALDRLREMRDDLDVVLICRGGGSRTDLAGFDSEALGRAVALFPLPVVVGIGHEQDVCVLDHVARRAKTPTAAAALLVERVREWLAGVEERGRAILDGASRDLADERRAAAERAGRLVRAAGVLLQHERRAVEAWSGRAVRGARGLVAGARRDLSRLALSLPSCSLRAMVRERARVDGSVRQLAQGARRDLAAAGTRLSEARDALAPRVRRLVAREAERTEGRERRLHLLDPRRVVERGYAILRRPGDGVVTAPGQAPAGTEVEAELRDGRLRLRSLGGEDGA